MCDELKVSQLIKILNLYTPADEFEERVSPSFVRKIQNKLQDRATLENEQQVRIKCNRIKKFQYRFNVILMLVIIMIIMTIDLF